MNLNVVISGSGRSKNREDVKVQTKGGNQRDLFIHLCKY